MHEDIVDFIKSQKAGVSSKELAEKFLKFKNPPESFAHAAIYGILSSDCRCYLNDSKMWCVVETISSPSHEIFEKLPLSAVYIICDEAKNDDKIAYISIWDINPDPTYKGGMWLTDHCSQNVGEWDLLTNGPEESYNRTSYSSSINKIRSLLQNRIPIFSSYNDFENFSYLFNDVNETFFSDSIFLCELACGASLTVDKDISLQNLSSIILNNNSYPNSAYRQGERFAQCIHEVISVIQNKGILTRNDLHEVIINGLNQYLKNKRITVNDLLKLPAAQGIYGLKNQKGESIIIGRTNNLRMMLYTCFIPWTSNTELDYVQNNSFSIDTYQCGSELENLLYEYRLIKKYNPIINKYKTDQKLSNGGMEVEDCIIFLPHAMSTKCMTFWIKKGQKILIKPIDLIDSTVTVNDIERYFFNNNNASIENHDQIEYGIVNRWISKNEGKLCILKINSESTFEEIIKIMQTYIRDFKEKVK